MLPTTAPASGRKNAVPLHVTLPTLPTLPTPGTSRDVTPASTAVSPPAAPTGAMPVIKSFLRLQPDFIEEPVHPEEGRIRVVLQAVHDALAPMGADLPEATAEQRARLRKAVTAHLAAQLDDASLDTVDLAFLDRVSGRLVAATLDGDYAGLQGSGDRLDTLRGTILEPKKMRESVLVRRWGIGDLSDNGVEATPSRLRSVKVSVHRGSALLAEGLLATAYLTGQLHGAAPPSLELARRVAAARLTAYLLVSALAHEPMLFDLDRLDRLTVRANPDAQGHVAALKALWPAVNRLSDLGISEVPAFLSGSERADAQWHPAPMHRLLTEDSKPFVQLIGLAPTDATGALGVAETARPLDESPLPLLRSLMPDVHQRLTRESGEVALIARAGKLLATLQVPALTAIPGRQPLADQDAHLKRLDQFMLTVFGDEMPLQGQLLPTQATLTEDQFLVGTRALAERQPDDRWVFDDDGVAVAREIYGEDAAEGPIEKPLDRWVRLKSREPRPAAVAVGTELVRVFIQMENDRVMLETGRDLSAAHPNRVVWVQSHPDGTFRVIRGQSLLDGSGPDTRFKLLVCGHGHTSTQTRERLLSNRTAAGLAEELSRLMPQLRIRSVESISLLSCALETTVEQRSFGHEFVRGVTALGAADMETTVYADYVLSRRGSTHFRKYTQLHDNAPMRSCAAGKTWIFRVDPDGGSVSVRDKFPNGDDGVDVPVSCCSILKLRAHPETTGRSLALTDAGAAAWSRLRGRFREVVAQHRPAGMHLVPSLTLKEDGPAVLTYLRLGTGEAQTREVVAPADIAVLRAGFSAITSGLADIRDQGVDVGAPNNRLDLLNLGMLALMLSDLAADGSTGDAFQEALWYLGVTQGGFQLSADAAAMASVIVRAAGRNDATSLGLLVNSTENLSKALTAVSRLAQAGTIATDVARLIDSLGVGNRARVTQAAVQVGLDAAGLALVGVAAAADLAGLVLLAAVAEGLAVPLQGLIVGIAALNAAVTDEIGRLNNNLGPLKQIDKGYGEPLVRAGLHPQHPEQQALLVNGLAPLRRIDFVKGTVTFADVTVGGSALHRNQLYWQGGSHRLHDWWISDNADHQAGYARHGQELDLWTLLRRGDRPTSPKVPLSKPLRDPDLVLGLVTPPNMAIHFDQYSSSRAGGDFALLGDPLIEQMQENSGASFVGDYVSSSSFARSADLWRFEQKPTLLEVALDDQPRMLALPGKFEDQRGLFVFSDPRSIDQRTLRPLNQSQVHVRLIGGGGRCTIALPPDGAVRNPVRILPSPHTREVWTMLLRGGLLGGGKPMAFLDGGVAGFSIAGQEFHFEALNNAIVQIADPLVPGARLIVDVQRKTASLVLTLPPWTGSLDPAAALTRAIDLLSAPEEVRTGAIPPMFRSDATGRPPGLVQLVSRLETGELLSGLLDPATGATLLYGAHHLLLLEQPRPGMPPPAWQRYALKGGELSLSDDKRPSVRYDGGRNFGPITYTYQKEIQRFVRDRLAITDAGKQALMTWSSAHPGWTRDDLRRFLTSELAAGVELAGPGNNEATPVDFVDFYYQNIEGRLPTEGWTAMALWSRLDRLRQGAATDGPVPLDGDPALGKDMVRAGLATFPQTGAVAAADVDRALQWLVLSHSQATGAYGSWSDLHPPAPPLTLQERTDLVMLRTRLADLLDQHRKASNGSPWIKLGDTPQTSESMAHRLRDADVDIRIDALDLAPASRATDRSGPTDFYDVQEPSLRLFMHDVTDRLERDAATVQQLRGVQPPGPSDTPLQASLTRLAASRAVAASHGAPVSPVPAEVLEQVRRAGLTFWSPAVDESSVSDTGTRELERYTASGTTRLGRVSYVSDGGVIDDATLRWWRAQAATQGLLPDAWYACHARPDSPMEILLRPAAAEALRERLIRLRTHADKMNLSAMPLHDDAILRGQLLTALRRLLPDARAAKVVGQDTAVPGDVVRFVDDQGRGHYALMRRPDTNMLQLHRDPAALRGNPFWAYLCPVEDLDEHLRPPLAPPSDSPAVIDPAAYFSWSLDDPKPVLGGVYLYRNPYSQRDELFRLQRVNAKALPTDRPYDYFPVDGSSSADWHYLGNSESLSASELGAMANGPTPLKPQTFSVGLLEWWSERLTQGGGDYRNFRLEPEALEATTWGSSTFRLEESGTLYVGLDDNDATTFRLSDDPEFKLWRERFVNGRTAPRWLLIQGNGREIDLDGATSLGIPEIVILDEPGEISRRVDLDDRGPGNAEVFYEGRDLLIHEDSVGQLIRIRNALASATALPFDDEWTTGVQVTGQGGTRRLLWPELDSSLRLPMMALHGSTLDVVRRGIDLRITDAGQWSRMTVPDVFTFSDGRYSASPSGDDEALLRFPTTDGRWRLGRLSAPLIAAMGAGADTSRQWALVRDDEHALAFLEAVETPPADATGTRNRWSLAGAKLSEVMAAATPGSGSGLAPRWVPSDGLIANGTVVVPPRAARTATLTPAALTPTA
ncbi:hypothetical protein CDL60_22115 [Roseateles noduli]|nr:hypothetical protein CDL60_22115 [Roseateles noduli]